MSLITRCPACKTQLDCSPDQLRISCGWVRCGSCGEAFKFERELKKSRGETDFSRIQVDGAPARPEAVPLENLPMLMPPRDAPLEPPERIEHCSPAEHPSTAMDAAQDELIATPILLRPALPDDVHGIDLAADGAADGAATKLQSTTEDSGERQRAKRKTRKQDRAASRLAAPASTAMPTDQARPEEVTFMRDALTAAARTAPSRRWPAWASVPILLALLLLQIVLQDRDRLAVTAPALAPLLSQLCAPLGCELRPMRRIDALVIDNSSLNKVEDGLHFYLAVRNRSDIELAMPGIELTLTDTQDRPVVRRVLRPADLGASSGIAANSEWTGAITVEIANGADRIVGYRAIAFYP